MHIERKNLTAGRILIQVVYPESNPHPACFSRVGSGSRLFFQSRIRIQLVFPGSDPDQGCFSDVESGSENLDGSLRILFYIKGLFRNQAIAVDINYYVILIEDILKDWLKIEYKLILP